MQNTEYDKKITWWQSAKFRIISLAIIIILSVVFLWYII